MEEHAVTMKPEAYSSLSWQERRTIRNAYVELQDNKCFHCGENLDDEPSDKPPIVWSLFPENFLDHPVHLQHNHETDMTEGAVHAYCNAIMWQYEGR